MIENSAKILELFGENDGSLPDIEIDQLTAEEVVNGYEIIRNHAKEIVTESPYYWSTSKQCEVPFTIKENPASLVVSGEAEPFHACFGGILSPTQKPVPVLGVFVFQNTLSLDYRMGPEWDKDAVEGLFELISKITLNTNTSSISHKSNINDPEGTILQSYWAAYKNA